MYREPCERLKTDVMSIYCLDNMSHYCESAESKARSSMSASISGGLQSSMTKQSTKSSKRSKRSHNTTRKARSKILGREYGPDQKVLTVAQTVAQILEMDLDR